MSQKIIGKVAALENNPSTIDHFYFWTDKDTLLNPFDVVVVEHIRSSKTYGVVEEISHITDSESFLTEYFSNDFGSLDAVSNTVRVGMNFVLARVVKNTQNIYIPVQNGQRVSLGDREEIEKALFKMGMTNLYACISVPEVEDETLTNNSEQFHAHLGFHKVGTFKNCGYKFDRWYHMIWMEKIINEHVIHPSIKAYKDI